MAAMTFLTIPDGNLTYQDVGGTGTLAGTGSGYGASFWAGHQGVITNAATGGINLANPSADLTNAAGALVVRFKTTATMSGFRGIIGLGTTGNTLDLRLENTTNEIKLVGWNTTGNSYNYGSGVTPAVNTNVFFYLDWNGSVISYAANNGAKTAQTLAGTAPLLFTNGFPLQLGYGRQAAGPGVQIGGVAIFNAPLTDAQRTYLYNQTTPWTWGMALSAPIAGYIDVLPSAGANTGAPTLTLP